MGYDLEQGGIVGVLYQTEITQGFWRKDGRSDKEKRASKEILRKAEDKLSIWQFCCLLPLCVNPARESTSQCQENLRKQGLEITEDLGPFPASANFHTCQQ